MRRKTLIGLIASALFLTFAFDAAAIERAYRGRMVAEFKANCDECEGKTFRRFRWRKTIRRGVVDTTGSTVAVIQIGKGRVLVVTVNRKNDRNGKFTTDANEATDQMRAASFLNSYDLGGTVEVTRVKRVKGFQRILGKRFNKNRSELQLTGEYNYLDGPNAGRTGSFKFGYEHKGKDIGF